MEKVVRLIKTRKFSVFGYLSSLNRSIATSITLSSSSRNDLFDFDANLLHPDLIQQISHHIATAQRYGIKYFGVPGSTIDDSLQSLDLASNPSSFLQRFGLQSTEITAQFFSTAGVHPYHTQSIDYSIVSNQTILKSQWETNRTCSAIGECGLDYSDGFPDKTFQLPWFQFQVEHAFQSKLPLYLHVREAHTDFLQTLTQIASSTSSSSPPSTSNSTPCSSTKNHQSHFIPSMAIHCFTGSTEELLEYLSLPQRLSSTSPSLSSIPLPLSPSLSSSDGLSCEVFIGLTGYVMNENKVPRPQLREWLHLITLDRLLIETDAPYMGFTGCRQSEIPILPPPQPSSSSEPSSELSSSSSFVESSSLTNNSNNNHNIKENKNNKKKNQKNKKTKTSSSTSSSSSSSSSKHDKLIQKEMKLRYPNVPSSLIQIVQYLSLVSGWEEEEIKIKTRDNALRFFRSGRRNMAN